jgi:hypothetical protein
MIVVSSGSPNNIEYYSRYNRIDKWEIIDEQTNVTTSGLTSIIGSNGLIQHTGLTYNFVANSLYLYKAYFISGSTYLSYQGLIRSFSDDTRLENYTTPERTNTFKNKQ